MNTVRISPVRFDNSSQERFLHGHAAVMMQSMLREAFGDLRERQVVAEPQQTALDCFPFAQGRQVAGPQVVR